MKALLRRLFARSASAQIATVVDGTIGEGAALTTIRFFGVGSGILCFGGHDKRER